MSQFDSIGDESSSEAGDVVDVAMHRQLNRAPSERASGLGSIQRPFLRGVAGVQETHRVVVGKAESCYHCADNWPKPARCLLCCCCWSYVGLRELVTSGKTIELATAFVLGQAFGALINSIVSSVVAPCVLTLFDIEYADIHSFPGFLLLTNPNNVTVVSAVQAVEQGCRVLNHDAVIKQLFTFSITVVTLFWITNGLSQMRVEKEEERQEEQLRESPYVNSDGSLSLCPACCEPVKPLAKRCPHCTEAIFRAPVD